VQVRFRVVIGVVLALTLLPVFASPASAATITCNKNGGAPSVGGSGGTITSYYSHRCNVNPGANEVEYMLEQLTLSYRPVEGSTWAVQAYETRNHVQAGVDFSFPWPVGSQHGYYRAEMLLILKDRDGQNFSYGSVPGCGRDLPDTVTCSWIGAQVYF
jgi:hypothetical protein